MTKHKYEVNMYGGYFCTVCQIRFTPDYSKLPQTFWLVEHEGRYQKMEPIKTCEEYQAFVVHSS